MSDYTKKQIGFAALTFAIYTFCFSWKIALLIMVTVGFHEYSHLFAARKLGMKTKGFFFIPFVGGLALVGDQYKKLSDKAIVLLAGPVGGGLLAACFAGAWYVTQIPILGMAAYWMGLVNLFNLIPFSFLDGGQLLHSIASSINRTVALVGLTLSTIIGAGLLLKVAPIIGALIVVFGGMAVWKEFNNWKALRDGKEWLATDDYLYPPTKMSGKEMMLTVGAWSLAAGLLMLMIGWLPESNLADLFNQ